MLERVEADATADAPVSLASFGGEDRAAVAFHAVLLIEAGLVVDDSRPVMDSDPDDFELVRLT